MTVPTEVELATSEVRRRIIRRRLLMGLLMGSLWGAALVLGLIWRAGDETALVHFAAPFTDINLAPEDFTVLPEGQGYDGQFYYRLARAPLSNSDRVDGVQFDDPALRMTRIGYPFAVRVVSLGIFDSVTSMMLTNVLAFGAAGAAGAVLAVRAGRTHWLGLIVLFVPSMTYGMSMAITDSLAGALLLCALAALTGRHWLFAALALSAAALTRESTLVLSVVLLCSLPLSSRFGFNDSTRRGHAIVGLTPIAAVLTWQVVVYMTWNDVGVLGAGEHNLTIPFFGPIRSEGFFSLSSGDAVLNILIPLGCIAVILAAAMGLVRPATDSSLYPPFFVVVALAVATLVATMLGPQLLESFRNSTRAIGEATMLATVAAFWNRNAWSRLSLCCLVLVGFVVIAWEFKVTVGLPV